MRNALNDSLISLSKTQKFVFITGDLGFMALEPLRDQMKNYFLNAGISEQNMISVAAGIASEGLPCWTYSIAPFIYARPFEQIRNDVVHHKLDVTLVGNGGGYAYGAMGPTHHALEDYGTLLTLSIKIFAPAFSTDIEPVTQKISQIKTPKYLRLGRDESPTGWQAPAYKPWRKVLTGQHGVLLATGALVSVIVKDLVLLEESQRPELWAVCEFPFNSESFPPPEFIESITHQNQLLVAEEHVCNGGLGSMISYWLMMNQIKIKNFNHSHAMAYPSQRFGSQNFHRKDSGLDTASLLKKLELNL